SLTTSTSCSDNEQLLDAVDEVKNGAAAGGDALQRSQSHENKMKILCEEHNQIPASPSRTDRETAPPARPH
ncbi:unnamed protein product, partial [Amoebophrya sp. A120]